MLGRFCGGRFYEGACVGALLCLWRYCVWGSIVSGALLCLGRYCVVGLFCQDAISSGLALVLGALLCQGRYCVGTLVLGRLCGGVCVNPLV